MFDFIPTSAYTGIYYHALLLVMMIIFVTFLSYDIKNENLKNTFSKLGYFIMFILILYMGLRPLNFRFGDMVNYEVGYRKIQQGLKIIVNKDFIFNNFMIFCAKIMDSTSFFLLVDVIYIIPYYVFSKKYFGNYWFFSFFLFICGFSFWSYGTNGIRNGMATSIFILGLCFYERKVLMYLFFALAYGIHNSLIIPIAAFVVSGIYKNPKVYIYIWLASIPLSIIGGSFWEHFFGNLGFGGDRATDYLTKGNVNNDKFSSTGFRWDFVLYSASATFAGWHFIFRKKVNDRFYIHLWGIYIIANAFWILVIRANFSNRFAYLSWFLMAPVIAYPLLRYKLWNDQYKVIGLVIMVYYMFTYIMFLKT